MGPRGERQLLCASREAAAKEGAAEAERLPRRAAMAPQFDSLPGSGIPRGHTRARSEAP